MPFNRTNMAVHSQEKEQDRAPYVSVLIPVYNGERFLRQTIESILAQTFTDFELILVDDCSSDRSAAIIQSYNDPRIRFFVNDKNLGNGGTRNRLVQLARGKYCAVLDHDDLCLPERLERQVKFLDAHPEIGFCSSAIEIIDEQGQMAGERWYNIPANHEEIKCGILFCCPVSHVTVMFRREEYLGYGLKYTNGGADDMSLFSRAVEVMRFTNLPEPLVCYRLWKGQFSATGRENQMRHAMEAFEYVYSKIGITLDDQDRAVLFYTMQGLRPTDNLLPAYRRLAFRIWKANRTHKKYDKHALRKQLHRLHRHKRGGITPDYLLFKFRLLF